MDAKFCLLIPHYNHHRQLTAVVERLEQFTLPLILVDDGSRGESLQALGVLVKNKDWIHLEKHAVNQGKGGAVKTGLGKALERQYTHAIQIDADGQHNVDDVQMLMALARQYPDNIICGLPQFDKSLPLARYYGRMLTHSLVVVETLSLRIKDAMCGFRIYPLEQISHLLQRQHLGSRMDFDVEILVKADWAGISILFQKTRVSYPEAGLSHFDFIKDNVLISRMHLRLLFGMLPRAPKLLARLLLGAGTR